MGCAAASILVPGSLIASTDIILLLDPPVLMLDFEDLDVGDSLADAGWTQNASQFPIGTPRQGGQISGNRVVAMEDDSSNTRLNALSPDLSITPAFGSSDTVYFSAKVNKSGANASGADFRLQSSAADFGEANFARFGVGDTSSTAGQLRLYDGSTTHWSSFSIEETTWYELVLVIELNPTNISESLGSLFYRNLGAGDTTYTLAPDLYQIAMVGFTEDSSPLNFQAFRPQARRNFQFTDLASGYATIIPEPGAATLLGTGLVWLLLRRSRRRA